MEGVTDGSQLLDGGFGPLRVGPGLVADRGQFSDAILQRRVGQIGDAGLDRVIQALELGLRLGRPSA